MLTLQIFRLFLLFFLLLSTTAFGNVSTNNAKTLLNIKIYFEPHEHKKKLTYNIILPNNVYYSYSIGSDLPTWHFVNKNIVQGEFYPVELVNIRIHSRQDNVENKKAHITIKDAENLRIIWQGDLHYGNKNKVITAVTKIDNKKYYDTKLKFDNAENTVWLEMTDRA